MPEPVRQQTTSSSSDETDQGKASIDGPVIATLSSGVTKTKKGGILAWLAKYRKSTIAYLK
jgi:hypothetical protein